MEREKGEIWREEMGGGCCLPELFLCRGGEGREKTGGGWDGWDTTRSDAMARKESLMDGTKRGGGRGEMWGEKKGGGGEWRGFLEGTVMLAKRDVDILGHNYDGDGKDFWSLYYDSEKKKF